MNQNSTTTYETPTLVMIGNAEDAIRGVYSNGYDGDTLYMVSTLEFQSELGLND
jgi:hypothetical protein